MLEAELQSLIVALCTRMGLETYHTHDSRRSDPGWLDLVIGGSNGVIFRELKTETGRVTPEQQRWIDVLTAAGMDAAVWRPADWPTRVQAELQPLGRLAPQRTFTQAELRAHLQKGVTKSPRRGANNFPAST